MVEQYTLQSSDEQTELHLLYWPLEHPKAVIQLIHGMAENIERYHAFALYLNSLGFAVVGHDHLGHGHSVQQKEPLYGTLVPLVPRMSSLIFIKSKLGQRKSSPHCLIS